MSRRQFNEFYSAALPGTIAVEKTLSSFTNSRRTHSLVSRRDLCGWGGGGTN
jgi:hypothetical protein